VSKKTNSCDHGPNGGLYSSWDWPKLWVHAEANGLCRENISALLGKRTQTKMPIERADTSWKQASVLPRSRYSYLKPIDSSVHSCT
jgi:hypothetical protein